MKKTLHHHAKREALIVLAAVGMALAWTLGYCYLRGYTHDVDSWAVRSGLATAGGPTGPMILGMPEWILVGVITPWLLCAAFSIGFSLWVMQDDDLGREHGEAQDEP